jgi:cation diffusion facilitator CzcD-associated flavoprotein CzcO
MSEMLQRKRIGVIGSGAGGLQVAKCMVSAGFDCIVIDKAPKVGGLWQSNYRLETFVIILFHRKMLTSLA